jgi:hypothetical protein
MELDEQQYAEYAKGYNHAQIVADYDPELLASITADVNAVDEYFNGFFDFKHEHEQALDELKMLQKIRASGRDEQEQLLDGF